MPKSSWTEIEIKFLEENYKSLKTKELSQKLGKTTNTVKEFARRRGLSKEYDIRGSCRIGSFKKLLEEIPESYYWLGYIMADGHLSEQGRLSATCAWDREHLQGFANYLGSNLLTLKKSKGTGSHSGSRDIFYSTSVSDIENYKILRDKFDIHPRKTYNPPDLSYLNEDWKFYSFLIGFIDGDGSISKSKGIRIINYNTWHCIHQFIKSYLSGKGFTSSITINYRNESSMYISVKVYNYLIKFVQNNNLPVLKRKWDKT